MYNEYTLLLNFGSTNRSRETIEREKMDNIGAKVTPVDEKVTFTNAHNSKNTDC